MSLALLMGCDPELFVQKDGRFESAFGLVKGDKENPTPVNKGAVQVDGMALEFNIEPASTEEEFCLNISTVLEQLEKMVPEYRVMAVPVAYFGEEYIKSQPEKAKELGCNPDYDAWSGEENTPPNAELPFRTGAGHIHIGWCEGADPHSSEHFHMCRVAVKQLDVALGVVSVLFDPDTQRREMYGNPGAFRPKSYGVEYRVLSNFWVGNVELRKWVYKATEQAFRWLEEGRMLFEEVDCDIRQVIKTSDVQKAREICDKLGLLVPEV